MTTPIRLEVGAKVHTWEIKRELTPAEQGRLLQFLCACGRAWQVNIEAEDYQMLNNLTGLAALQMPE